MVSPSPADDPVPAAANERDATPPPDAPRPRLARGASSGGRLASLLPLGATFALAMLLRCLCVGLPIEGDAVAYGALARSLADGAGYAIDGRAHERYPPGHPLLLAIALQFGGTVTGTTRTLGVLLGGAVAVLLVSIGRRVIQGRVPTAALVVLAAAHPAFALFVGGLVPAAEGTALVLLLGAIRLALTEGPRARLAAVALAGLLPLVRYDLIAFPIAVGWHVHRTAKGRGLLGIAAARAPAFALLFAPVLAWILRTIVVSGRLFGSGYASHAFSFARIPANLLVLAGLVLPAAGLGILWIYVPTGVRRLLRARASDRPVVRTALLGAALHLALVAVFAGPTFRGDGALAFSSGSLRFGLAAVPFVVLAAVQGLAAAPVLPRRAVVLAVGGVCVLLSIWLVAGTIQRWLPFRTQAAGRLDALARAYDATVAAAARDGGRQDWIGLDLLPRPNAGVEVFLGDRAPERRTGVVAAAEVPPGIFPSAPVLPLREGLGGDVRCWLLSDLEYDGVIFTGERKDLGRGGRASSSASGGRPSARASRARTRSTRWFARPGDDGARQARLGRGHRPPYAPADALGSSRGDGPRLGGVHAHADRPRNPDDRRRPRPRIVRR